MAGFTNAESAATLDARYPTSGATDYVAYSVDGSSEWAGLARTAVGATGWVAATVADPAVKANGDEILTAEATDSGEVTHFAVFSASSGGNQRTDWTLLDDSKPFGVGDQARWSVGALRITLT